MNKKLLALLLAILMVAMSAVAMAADLSSVNLSKIYTENQTDAINPAEDFEFYYVTGSAKVTNSLASNSDAEALVPTSWANKFTVSYAEDTATTAGTTRNFTIPLPTFSQPGVYTYDFKETSKTTTGVAYDDATITMHILVQYEEVENKNDQGEVISSSRDLCRSAVWFTKTGVTGKLNDGQGFNNLYTAGTVKITKNVTGNLGDTTKDYGFKITFTGNQGETAPVIRITGKNDTINANENGEYTFTLKTGENIEFTNVAAGMGYTVVETEPYGHTVSYSVDGATAVESATYTGSITTTNTSDVVAFTNDKSETIQTGVSTDTMPYILLMAFVAILAVAFVAKKRSVNE